MSKALDVDAVRMCKRCVTLGDEHVPAEGNPSADVVIVGQSPGEQEVKELRPFIGPSGELIDFFLDEAGLARSQVYITNALKCHPPGNRPGNPEELAMCWKTWLYREIKFINPRIIVLVGKDAWMSVTQGKIPFVHGNITEGSKRAFMTVYHPGYFLRRGDTESFVSAGGKLKEFLNGI